MDPWRNLRRSTRERCRRLTASRVALSLAVTLVSSLATAIGIEGAGAASASAAPIPCGTSVPAAVNYLVGPSPSGTVVVRSVKVSGLPASCSGEPVVVDLYGNHGGDPAVSQMDDELLAQVDSTLDPCTQQPLARSGLLANGAITLPLCPSGGSAGVVSVHDLTGVALSVAGESVATASNANSGNGLQLPTARATAATASSPALAFTGAEIGSAVLAGVLALAAGTLLVGISRRRRNSPL